MADNRGVVPLDPTTDVGRLRTILGDTVATPYDPPEPGFGMYEDYSDAELEAMIGQGESVEDGAYLAYMQMAGAAAREAKSIQDFDLKIDTTKRAEALLKMAQLWKDAAEAASADIFEVFDMGDNCRCAPELAAKPFCYRRCNYGGIF